MVDLSNPCNGEGVLNIGDDEYEIVFNFDNLVALQSSCKLDMLEIYQAIGRLNVDVISRVAHAGIIEGKSWPERFGKRPPGLGDLRKSMRFTEVKQYVDQLMTTLQGAGFADDPKKTEEGTNLENL